MEKHNHTSPSRSATHQVGQWLSTRQHQISTVLLGLSLLVTGAAATFLSTNGTGSAALVGGGTFLLALGLLDKRIALLKVGDIEFHLNEAARQLNHEAAALAAQGNEDAAEQLRKEAQGLLGRISPVARAYEEVRRIRPPLAERITEMSKVTADAKKYSSEHHPSAEAVRAIFDSGGDGERLYALALMQSNPKTTDIESVLDAISNSHSAFEQYNALVAAQVTIDKFGEADKIRLATAIRRQMGPDGYISKSTDRRRVAEQILNITKNNLQRKKEAMGERIDRENQLWGECLKKEELNALDGWLAGKSYSIRLDYWMTGGSKGVPLAIIRRSVTRDGQIAFKFLSSSEQARRWDTATHTCPKGFKKHIIPSEDPSKLDSSLWVLPLEIGGGDISKYRPLADLAELSSSKNLAKACHIIIDSILKEWNPASTPVREVPVSDYFGYIFDRSRAQEGGTLYRTLKENSIDRAAKIIRSDFWPDKDLPNPLTFVDYLCKPNLQCWHGNAHQDLHTRNILLSIDPFKPGNYKLIDLGNFNPDSPLALDPMVLLLSIAMNWLQEKEMTPDSPSSRKVINVIVDDSPEESLQPAFYEVSHAIRETGRLWAAKQGSGADWTAQSLLSLTACGLRYASRTHKGVKDQMAARKWYFYLSALAARKYLEKTDQWEEFKKSPSPMPAESISEFTTPVVGIREDDHSSEIPIDSDPIEARIIDFPIPRQQQTRKELTRELRSLELNSRDWRIRSAKSGSLRRLLPEQIQACRSDERNLRSLLRDLENALKVVVSPLSTNSDLHPAINEIKRITPWILRLINE